MRISPLVAGALLLALPAYGQVSAPMLTGTERRLTTNLADQYDPAISGDIVVYTDLRGADSDIWYFDLATGTEHPVTTARGDQQLNDVSGGVVTYTDLDNADVLIYSIGSGVTSNLTSAAGSISVNPAVGASIVAWEDNRDGNREIYAHDLVSGEERRISNSPGVDQSPAVGDGVIVWQRCTVGLCDIFAYDWATGATRQVTDTLADDERRPDVSGGRVVYDGLRSGERDIYLFDLATGVETRLILPGDQSNPSISGDFVAFDDLSGGNYDIRLWHIPTGAVFQITADPSGQYLNDIDGNRIVYTDNRNGQLDIYLYEFTLELPPPPPSGVTDCDHTEGAVPLLDVTLDRTRAAPNRYTLPFEAPAGPGLVCIENGGGRRHRVSSAWVSLNGDHIASPNDFYGEPGDHGGDCDSDDHHCAARIERHVALLDANVLDAVLASKPGSALRVVVWAAQAEPPHPVPGIRHHRHDADHHPPRAHGGFGECEAREIGGASSQAAGAPADPVPGSSVTSAVPQPTYGCDQSGGGAWAPWGLALLAVAALAPRRARAVAPARWRRA